MRPRRPVSSAKPGGRKVPRAGPARWLRRLVVVLLLAPLAFIVAFRFLPVPLTPLMVIRLVEGYEMRHDWVPYERISPVLVRAAIASEDNLFCREPTGIDIPALVDQVAVWRSGERPRGASTITMQTAKNLLLWPGRDPLRKLLEVWLTPQMALLWPKRRVMEVYLNSIEFGPGVYGAEAASRHFFGAHAADLSVDQAIRLAVVLPAPLHWSAQRPNATVQERARIVHRRMGELGAFYDCVR